MKRSPRAKAPVAVPDETLLEELGSVFGSWAGAASRDLEAPGAELARTVAHVLAAVHRAASEGDLEALTDRGGPDLWARRYLGRTDPLPKRSLAARRFVQWIGVEIRRRSATDTLDLEPEALAFADRALGLLAASELPAAMRKNVPGGREVVRRVAVEVMRVAHRRRPKPEAYATAVLRGWGLTLRQAQDALKLA